MSGAKITVCQDRIELFRCPCAIDGFVEKVSIETAINLSDSGVNGLVSGKFFKS